MEKNSVLRSPLLGYVAAIDIAAQCHIYHTEKYENYLWVGVSLSAPDDLVLSGDGVLDRRSF